MTEPSEIAPAAEEVVPGLWHWRIRNSNIGGSISSSHALRDGEGSILIDPVRLDPAALAALPRPSAVCLTSKGHQRAAWRYRDDYELEVWAPDGAPPMDGEPDRRYRDGDALPGGLRALRTPGPAQVHYSFLLEREPGVLFSPDLLMHPPGGALELVPLEYHDDPEQTLRTIEGLLDLPFSVLCLDHGAPLTGDPKAAIRQLLAER
jgi:hypothetical protein